MLKGFKEFVMRGNIVDLAVAFVIATAFAALVEIFVSAIIKPILAVITPGSGLGFGFFLSSGNPATFINVGTLINALIVFVLTAALIYFLLVVPMNKVREAKAARALARGEVPEPALATDVELLVQIRDLLAKQKS